MHVVGEIVVGEVAADLEVHFDSVIDPESSWQAQCPEVVVRDVVPCDAHGTPSA